MQERGCKGEDQTRAEEETGVGSKNTGIGVVWLRGDAETY